MRVILDKEMLCLTTYFRAPQTDLFILLKLQLSGTQSFLRSCYFLSHSSILWKPKVYYRIYSSPSTVPILNQINPIHTFVLFFLQDLISCFILSSMSGSSKQSLFPRLPDQNFIYTFHPLMATSIESLSLIIKVQCSI
jgi:hypothetical protein